MRNYGQVQMRDPFRCFCRRRLPVPFHRRGGYGLGDFRPYRCRAASPEVPTIAPIDAQE